MIHTHHTQCLLDIITTNTFPLPCNTSYDNSFITRFCLFIITTPSLHKLIHKIEYFFVTEKHKNTPPTPLFFDFFLFTPSGVGCRTSCYEAHTPVGVCDVFVTVKNTINIQFALNNTYSFSSYKKHLNNLMYIKTTQQHHTKSCSFTTIQNFRIFLKTIQT